MESKKKREKRIKERVAAKVAQKLEELKQLREEKHEKHRKHEPKTKAAKAVKTKVEKVKTDVKKRAEKRSAQKNTVTEDRLELLFTIVNRNKGEYYTDLLQSFDVNMQVMALGYGTANEKMLSAFGLDDSDKVVIISVMQQRKLADALRTLEEKFQTIKNGKGIAYTVPMSSVIGTLIFGFLGNNRKAVKENDK